MILIIGSEEDAHAVHLYQHLQQRGLPVSYLDTRTFPKQLQVELTPKDMNNTGYLTLPDGQRFPLNQIRSVYWRWLYATQVPEEVPSELAYIAFRELESALGSLWRFVPDALWINSIHAIEMHRYKPYQLSFLAQAGLPIPDTLVTNRPEAVRAFYTKHRGQVIYKPVSGGAHTQKMVPEDLTPERLSLLSQAPIQVQEMIEGVDVRVYLVGDKLFAAEIQAQTLDFRDDPKAPVVPITLSAEVEAQCRLLAERFHYVFTGIDLRKTPAGNYVFLEGNPSPMFVYFERQTGYPITETLLDLLETGKASI